MHLFEKISHFYPTRIFEINSFILLGILLGIYTFAIVPRNAYTIQWPKQLN